jgi:hypothetical protein
LVCRFDVVVGENANIVNLSFFAKKWHIFM